MPIRTRAGGDPVEPARSGPAPSARAHLAPTHLYPADLGPRILPAPIRKVRDTFRAHPLWQDVLLALGVLTMGALDAGLDPRPPDSGVGSPIWFILATGTVQAAALLVRRRRPMVSFAVILAVCTVTWALGTIHRSDISVLLALYAVGRYATPPRLPWVSAATLVSVAVADSRIEVLRTQFVFAVFVMGTPIAASVMLGLAARDRHAQLVALSERAARLEREREQRSRLATLAERARVSREMHDILGHTLAVIVGLADGGASQVTRKPEQGQQALEMIAQTGREALAELRVTLSALQERPLDDEGAEAHSLNPQPSAADLVHLLDRIRAAGPEVDYRTSGDLTILPRSVQLALFRIVQEAVTNSLKHAGPRTTIHVAVETDGRQVLISVADTGDPERPPPVLNEDTAGRGLVGIRERAALAGGTAQAAPRAGGWTVRAALPLTPHEEPAE